MAIQSTYNPFATYTMGLQGGSGASIQGSASPMPAQKTIQGPVQSAPKKTAPKVTYGNTAATSPKQQFVQNLAQPASRDLSSGYAQVSLNGNPTNIRKSDNYAYSTKEDFLRDIGDSEYGNYTFDKNYQYTPNTPSPVSGAMQDVQPANLPKANNDPYTGYKNAFSDYLKALAPSEDVISAKKKYLDFVSSAESGIAGLEGQGRGIPLTLVRGQQEKLGKQAEITAKRLGQDVELAQGDQTLLQNQMKERAEFEKNLAESSKPIEVGGNLVRFNPETGEYETAYSAPATASSTDDLKEYNFAKGEGYNGSFLQYMQEKAMLNPSAYDVTTDAFGNTKVVSKLGGGTGGGTSGGGGTIFTPGTGGMRTDRHNNPTAFTTDIAKQAGLKEGVDYTVGDAFPDNPNLKTAKLLGDPIATTIKVIDKIGFYTQSGQPRWTYVNQLPNVKNWANLDYNGKAAVIAEMYKREGGSGQFGGAQSSGNPQLDAAVNQVLANPQSFESLSPEQQAAVSAEILRQGKTLPTSTKPATDAQNTSAGYALRVQQSTDILNQLENSIVGMNPASYEALSRLPSYAQGSTMQSFEQAARNFINAILRRESGAVISNQEFQNAEQQYLPMPRDSAQVLAQKKANRDAVFRGLINSSGSAWTNLTGGSASSPLSGQVGSTDFRTKYNY